MHRPATPRPPARDGRGFTLVELLVVIVIIAVLMAILLPAVQAVREGGRRVVCTTSQYNMALAIGQFNSSKRYIPGWRNWVSGSSVAYSWPVVILPNMERKDVYNAITSNPATPPSTYLAFYSCPSSPPDTLANNPTLAYAGNAGAGSNATGLRATGVMLDITATGTMNARVSIDDVANNDGQAMTLLLSEECGPQIPTAGSWTVQPAAGNGVVNWSSSTPVFGIVNATIPTKVVNSVTFSTTAPSAANMPNSNHPGGAVVVFCDGHTGFLKDTLQAKVYAQLLSWSQAVSGTTTPYSTWVGTYTVLQQSDYE